MTDFEKRARLKFKQWVDTWGTKEYGTLNIEGSVGFEGCYVRGFADGNADREAYAAERVREERERILKLLKGGEARDYEVWFNKNNPRDPDADDWAYWLETRLKAEAGKGKQE